MPRHYTKKPVTSLILTLALLLCSASQLSAEGLTQRDWMVTLVDAMGLSYGLPDEPQDPDYINILTGNRLLRIEAEDSYREGEDNVSLMSFRNFGRFSGRGWLHGTTVATDVHLQFTLPVGGEYTIRAHIRQAGHTIKVGETSKKLDAPLQFTQVEVGTFTLQNGPQKIVVTLPANGSIDYISLSAPNLQKITPRSGWQPDAPLNWETLRTTMLQILDLSGLFPEETERLVMEAEEVALSSLRKVGDTHLGRPSGGQWLRTGPLPGEARFPISIAESGFYELIARGMGAPIEIVVGSHLSIPLSAKTYLDDFTFKSLYFFSGESSIVVKLPAEGGIDKLTLIGRKVTPEAVDTLLGLNSSSAPAPRDLDHLASLLAAFNPGR